MFHFFKRQLNKCLSADAGRGRSSSGRQSIFFKKFVNFIVMGSGFVANFSLGLGRGREVLGGFGCGGGLLPSGFFRNCGVMPRAVVNSELRFRRERTFPSFLSGIGKLRELVCSAPGLRYAATRHYDRTCLPSPLLPAAVRQCRHRLLPLSLQKERFPAFLPVPPGASWEGSAALPEPTAPPAWEHNHTQRETVLGVLLLWCCLCCPDLF